MKVIDIVPKHIAVSMEFSSEEVAEIRDFLDKAITLYERVYGDFQVEESDSAVLKLKESLTSVLKAIESEMQK